VNAGPRFFLWVAATLLASYAPLVASDSYLEFTPQGRLSGELHCMGTDVMDGLTVAWLDIFRHAYPQVEATMEARGANTAFPGLISGKSQIAPLSRAASSQEIADFKAKFGYPPTEVRVTLGTYDAFGLSPPSVVVVSQDNPLRELSLAQLEQIYARDGTITTWGQLGLEGRWKEHKIAVWGLRVPNGTATFFQESAMHGRPFRPTMTVRPTSDGLSRTAQRAPNGGVQAFVDILAAVRADPFAIGYAAPGYDMAGLQTIALRTANGREAIAPTRENVMTLRYPLCRFTYLYLNRPPGKALDPRVREFVRGVLSKPGQALIAERSGFLPLPPAIARAEWEKLQ
jgi:phosphate transport system substrate-binding protein